MTDGVCGTPGCLRTAFHEAPEECSFWPPKHQNVTSSIQAKEVKRLTGVVNRLIDQRNAVIQERDALVEALAQVTWRLSKARDDAEFMLAAIVASAGVVVVPPLILELDWEVERLDTPNGYIRFEAKRKRAPTTPSTPA